MHLLALLDLLVHKSIRDLRSRGAPLDETTRPVEQHVARNPFLCDRICARWRLPRWAGAHADRFFVSAPLFMEARHSHHVAPGQTHATDLGGCTLLAANAAPHCHCSSPARWQGPTDKEEVFCECLSQTRLRATVLQPAPNL